MSTSGRSAQQKRTSGELKTLDEVEGARTERGTLSLNSFGSLLAKIEACRSMCYVLVTDGRSERCVFLPVGGARLSSIGRRRGGSLIDHVRNDPDVASIDSAARALDALANSGGSLEEALTSPKARKAAGIDERSVDALTKAIDRCSRAMVRDELIDLVAWEGADYEFRESNPPTEIFDAQHQAVKLSLGVKDVLKEVREKIDEWRALSARLGAGPTARLRRGSSQAPSDSLEAAIFGAVGAAEGTVDEAILAGRRVGADAVQGLATIEQLCQRGALDLLKDTPKKSADEERARAEADAQEIEGNLPLMMNQIASRRRLASAYRVCGDTDNAIKHLRWVGDELTKRDEPEAAMDAYRQIVAVAPNAFYAREQIAELFERMGKKADAIREWLELAKLYAKNNLLNRAQQKLKRAVRLDPTNADHRRRLIDVLLAMELKDAAARELEDLAKLYEAQGKNREALCCYQQIHRIQPTNKAALARLQAVASRQLSNVIPMAGVVLGGFVLLTLAGFVQDRYKAISAFAAARDAALEHAQGRRFMQAVVTLEEFTGAYPRYAPERVVRVRDRIRDREVFEARGRFMAGKRLEAQHRLAEALATYEDVATTYPTTEWGDRATRQAAEVHAFNRKAAEEADRVDGLLRAGKPDLAFARARDLLREFPGSDASANVRLPFFVKTTPAGASMSVDGQRVEGVTPRVASGVGNRPIRLTLELDGQEPRDIELDLSAAQQSYVVEVELARTTRWRALARGPLPFSPSVEGGLVVVAGADEMVQAFDTLGAPRWTRSLGFCAEAAGAPLRAGDAVVVVDVDGKVTGLAASNGAPLWTWQGEPGLAPVGVIDGGAVLASADRVVMLDAKKGNPPRWVQAIQGTLAAPPVIGASIGIMAAMTDGSIQLYDAATGAGRKMNVAGRPSAPPAVAPGGLLLISTEDGFLRLVGRVPVWQAQLPAANRLPPIVAGEHVYVACGAKLVALVATTGRQAWARDFPAPITAVPAFRDGRLYVPLGDGRVHALTAASGVTRWVFKTEGEVLATPVASDRAVYVASTDRTLTAVTE